MTIELILTLVLIVLFIAGVIYIEIKFAKINNTDDEQDDIQNALKELGVTKIVSDGKGWLNFWLEDECLWLNLADAPHIGIFLQNAQARFLDLDVATQVAEEMTSRLAGGRVVIKGDQIYFGWESILAGEDALKMYLPIIFGYLAQVREKFISAYWETLATKKHDNTKPVS